MSKELVNDLPSTWRWQSLKTNSLFVLCFFLSLSLSLSLSLYCISNVCYFHAYTDAFSTYSLKANVSTWRRIHGNTTESPTHHNHHKAKHPKAAHAHGHQQSSANATATGLLSECHGVDVKTRAKEKHLKSMSLKGPAKFQRNRAGPEPSSCQST